MQREPGVQIIQIEDLRHSWTCLNMLKHDWQVYNIMGVRTSRDFLAKKKNNKNKVMLRA